MIEELVEEFMAKRKKAPTTKQFGRGTLAHRQREAEEVKPGMSSLSYYASRCL